MIDEMIDALGPILFCCEVLGVLGVLYIILARYSRRARIGKADSLSDLSDRDLDYILKDAERGGDMLAQLESRGSLAERSFKRRRDHIPTRVRQAVWERDGGKCANCGATDDLQYDHIIPDSRGGGVGIENIELLCGTCNRQKAARIE